MRKSSIIVLLILFVLAGGAPAIENLVANPDFDEGGTNGWTITAGGQLKPEPKGVVGDCVHVIVDAVGANAWEPEIHSPSFEVKAGQVYTVAFWAKVPEGKTKSIGVKFEQLETWTGPSQNMIIDSPEWKEYFFSPNMTMSSPPSVVIHIQFNNETGELWLDHFRVYQGEYEEEEGIGEESTGGMAVQASDKLATIWARMK